MKSCVLILGAPRTGSSCLSGCVYSCGVDLGKSLSGIKDRYNEKGYFENEAILNFNRSVFSALGLKWDDRDLMQEEVSQTLLHQPKLVQILEDEYRTELCAIKDFRLGIFADLYQSALASFELKVIVIRRDMQAVIASMKKMFSWMDDEKAAWMYERCYRLFDSYSCPRLDLCFEDVVRDPVVVMANVCNFIGVDFGAEKQQWVRDFVEKGLVHEGVA